MAPNIRQQKVALSDSQGLFEFTALPAGRYQLMASKGGYANTGYGARRPGESGRPLDVAEGQKLENIEIALSPGGVITGRIVDEFGEPVAEAQVAPLRFRYMNGRRRPMMAGSPAQSNDVGQFRLFGLPPGEYLVSATLRAGGMMSFGADETSGDGTGYAPTYYPGTSSPGDAQRVQVVAGSETIADIQLTPTRVSRITGTVVDSTGRPARGGMINLSPKDGDGFFMGMNMTQIRPDGGFTIGGVAPGEYTLEVRANADLPSAIGRGSANPFESGEVAYTAITAAGDNIDGLRIVTGRGLTIAGQVTFEHGPPPADREMNVMLMPDTDGPRFGMSGGRVAADGTFEVVNVLGARRIMVNPPRGWMIKSITYRGRDVMDEAVDFRAGGPAGRIEVVVTSRLTSVLGGVQDASGRTLTDYTVMVFLADPARKPPPFGGFSGAKPDQQGRFKLEGLRTGRWLAVALADVGDEDRFDPEFIDRLRDKATPFELREGESRTLQLTLTPPPQ
jgi:hypothetical protein